MRWVLIVLLMLNGIYFAWQTFLLPVESVRAPVGVTVADIDSNRLVLLGELGAADVPDSPAVAEVEGGSSKELASPEVLDVAAAPESAPAPEVCWYIGPFAEEVTGKQVVGRLEALDISLRLQELSVPGKPDYWVHIPPLPTLEDAKKLHKELLAKKIDSFRIRDGELQYGISLGLFSERDRADKVYQKRLKQGYPAEIKVVERPYTEIWAVFAPGEYGKFSDELWERVKVGNKGLERRKNFCDKIASINNLE